MPAKKSVKKRPKAAKTKRKATRKTKKAAKRKQTNRKTKPPKKKAAAKKKKAVARKTKPPAKKKKVSEWATATPERRQSITAASKKARAKRLEEERTIEDPPVDEIDWDTRLATRDDPKLFCETYLPKVFYLGWSEDQLQCLDTGQTVFSAGGMFALAMPRGGGKTAICRGLTLWATAHALVHNIFLVAASDDKAKQSLNLIKTYWMESPELRRDFPEIGHAVWQSKGRPLLAKNQMYAGHSTYMIWATDGIRYPSLILRDEIARLYHENDPDSITYYDRLGGFVTKNSGCLVNVSGIDGAIRGDADVDPIRLTQPRPEVAILDDVQKDAKAESPTVCDKMERLIDGAVAGLAGPDRKIGVLMPCTIIRDGDVASRYLDPEQKPDYRGKIGRLVTSWPEGITDRVIGQDTPAGKLWTKYGEERRKSLMLHGDIRLATKFYKSRKNRKTMDKGFTCSWPDRIRDGEISPQQTAMNLRMETPITFASEYQNNPRGKDEDRHFFMLSPNQCAEKVTTDERLIVPIDHNYATCFIDVQNEVFFWMIMSGKIDFTSHIVAYGIWPDVGARSFRKEQTEGWSLVTKEFFKTYPDLREKAYRTKSGGHLRAPFEPKIYFGLQRTLEYIDGLPLVRAGPRKQAVQLDKIGIDVRWGLAMDVCKTFCRQQNRTSVLIPVTGKYYPPSGRQLEEYTPTAGWFFEHQKNKTVKQCKWLFAPDKGTGQYVLSTDVNRLKTFLHNRLSSPPGQAGSLTLHYAPPEDHSLLAQHLCNSELPVEITAREITKDQWQVVDKNAGSDNDWLDTAAGNVALLSMCGCCLSSTDTEQTVRRTKRKSWKQIYEEKRRRAIK